MSFGLPDDPPADESGAAQPPAEELQEIPFTELGAHAFGFIVNELEATPGFNDLQNGAREQLYERLRRQLGKLMEQVIVSLQGADFPSCRATLETVSLKSGITGRITVARTEPNRHELFDAVGKNVLILIADVQAAMLPANARTPQPSQMDLYEPRPAPQVGEDPKPGCRSCARQVGEMHTEACSVRAALTKDGTEDADFVLEADTQPDPEDAPTAEPEPEVPGEWVDCSTMASPNQEIHTGTNEVRRTREGLTADLVDKLSTYNLRTNVDSINIDHDAIGERTRTEILAAMLWIDSVMQTDGDTDVPAPTWLPLPKDLQP